ncbi:hypothetical protein [Rhodopseudomonas parapalustris]
MNKFKAIGVVGVFGMAAISGMLPAYAVAAVAAYKIISLEDEKSVKQELKELTVTKDDKKENRKGVKSNGPGY